jgi:hypothetical protein
MTSPARAITAPAQPAQQAAKPYRPAAELLVDALRAGASETRVATALMAAERESHRARYGTLDNFPAEHVRREALEYVRAPDRLDWHVSHLALSMAGPHAERRLSEAVAFALSGGD